MGQFPRFLRVSPTPKARPFWHATCPTTSWWSWSRPFFGKGNEQWRVLSDLFFGIFFHPERKVVKQWSPGFLEGGSWNSGIMGIEYEERYVFFFRISRTGSLDFEQNSGGKPGNMFEAMKKWRLRFTYRKKMRVETSIYMGRQAMLDMLDVGAFHVPSGKHGVIGHWHSTI